MVIPYNKPFISLQGAGLTATTIINSETASKSGTADSATFAVWAPNFVARGIGFVVSSKHCVLHAYLDKKLSFLIIKDEVVLMGNLDLLR